MKKATSSISAASTRGCAPWSIDTDSGTLAGRPGGTARTIALRRRRAERRLERRRHGQREQHEQPGDDERYAHSELVHKRAGHDGNSDARDAAVRLLHAHLQPAFVL